jgi:hypothetical protein
MPAPIIPFVVNIAKEAALQAAIQFLKDKFDNDKSFGNPKIADKIAYLKNKDKTTLKLLIGKAFFEYVGDIMKTGSYEEFLKISPKDIEMILINVLNKVNIPKEKKEEENVE